ncbi:MULTISPECIES: hypothetical protein [Burkholderia]|uniref:Uncharacterized protein n=2 Tax=Burkholderia cepacia complex TaxID=87882 RepID=A0AAP1V5A9_9BURK|nr:MULTISPECIES: hypothetical protein [Burkholderia]MBK1902111.1 hypothetical protein [Burkholderia contaminans]MBK1910394.1 hypothetical protein [Burkholderia contaminans]MBK1923853.1 hypothetical protein [Burkholderia contaminans]MBK1932065.1 hypothetical protein [Burkholderia contaminans]MBK1939314.1 hypothetical protein [Burkholderia contaminans]
MNSFSPHTVDDKPISPSRAERFLSLIAGASLIPVMVLQMVEAVPAHALQEALQGRGMPSLEAIGTVIDRLFAPLRGVAGMSNSQIAAVVELVSNWGASAVYYGALMLCVGSLAGSAMLAMRRDQKRVTRRMGDARSW